MHKHMPRARCCRAQRRHTLDDADDGFPRHLRRTELGISPCSSRSAREVRAPAALLLHAARPAPLDRGAAAGVPAEAVRGRLVTRPSRDSVGVRARKLVLHTDLDELRVQRQQRVGGDVTLGRWACQGSNYYRIDMFVVVSTHPGLQHVRDVDES